MKVDKEVKKREQANKGNKAQSRSNTERDSEIWRENGRWE